MIIQPLNAAIQLTYIDLSGDIDSIRIQVHHEAWNERAKKSNNVKKLTKKGVLIHDLIAKS